jgi:hypothetical protein
LAASSGRIIEKIIEKKVSEEKQKGGLRVETPVGRRA